MATFERFCLNGRGIHGVFYFLDRGVIVDFAYNFPKMV